MYDIYIVSADPLFARMLELELRSALTGTEIYNCGSAAPTHADSLDVIISDYSLLTLISRLQRPLVIIAPIDSEELSVTAGDVFTRPFPVSELVAHVRLLLEEAKASDETSNVNRSAPLMIDEQTRFVSYMGSTVNLTRREFELLSYLWRFRGNPVSREELIRMVWRYSFTGDTNVVDVYIRYLREKFDERFGVKLILTVRGKGYMIKA